MPNCYQLPVNIYTQYTQVLLSDQADIKHVVHICTNRKPLPLFDNLVADDWNGKVFRRRRSTAIVVHCELPCSRKNHYDTHLYKLDTGCAFDKTHTVSVLY